MAQFPDELLAKFQQAEDARMQAIDSDGEVQGLADAAVHAQASLNAGQEQNHDLHVTALSLANQALAAAAAHFGISSGQMVGSQRPPQHGEPGYQYSGTTSHNPSPKSVRKDQR